MGGEVGVGQDKERRVMTASNMSPVYVGAILPSYIRYGPHTDLMLPSLAV